MPVRTLAIVETAADVVCAGRPRVWGELLESLALVGELVESPSVEMLVVTTPAHVLVVSPLPPVASTPPEVVVAPVALLLVVMVLIVVIRSFEAIFSRA